MYPDLAIAWIDAGPVAMDAIPTTCRGSIEGSDEGAPSPQVTTKVQYRGSLGGSPLSREMIVNWWSASVVLTDCDALSGEHGASWGTFTGGPGPTVLADDGQIWEIIPILQSKVTGKSPSLPVRLSGQMVVGSWGSDDGSWARGDDALAAPAAAATPAADTPSGSAESPKVRSLPRISEDRPGPHLWDVKFLYVTFEDGPDEQRDTNGDIGGIAADVNRYMESQFPGHRIRYDTYDGALDIHHIQLPITNAEYYRLHTDQQGGVENLFQRALADAGYTWRWGSVTGALPVNTRIYYLMVEGFRGKKYGDNGESYDYECTGGDLQFDGLAIRHLRRLNGEPCPGVVGHWVPTPESWAASY
jgi:hypothetical protein